MAYLWINSREVPPLKNLVPSSLARAWKSQSIPHWAFASLSDPLPVMI